MKWLIFSLGLLLPVASGWAACSSAQRAELAAQGLDEETIAQRCPKSRKKSRQDSDAPAAPAASPFIRDCKVCPEMIVIPVGHFEMGSPATEAGRYEDEGPLHRVSLLKTFALARTEITQQQWRDIMGTPAASYFKNCDDCPVDSVSWNDAKEFLRRLSERTGEIYRLPSEAEWEYACRAGTRQRYCGGDNLADVAWYRGNSNNRVQPVAGKAPNAWGLHDMTGNVWEWTEDVWIDNYTHAPADGSALTRGGNPKERVLRGGSWLARPQISRAAFRLWEDVDTRLGNIGLRPVRELR